MPAERGEITGDEFAFMRDYVHKNTSIALGDNKEYLVQIRLEGVVRALGLRTIHEVVQNLRKGGDAALEHAVIEAMTTNETSFFRDPSFFEHLEKVVFPSLIEARRSVRSLTMWCAACSSGQEPYSILMMLREKFPEVVAWDLKFVVSDLSLEMVERTRNGLYSDFEVRRGLEPHLQDRWFTKEDRMWRVSQDLRRLLDVRQIHLGRPLPNLPRCDLVLLRNVLIYFDSEGKAASIRAARGVLAEDGWLILGTSEVLPGGDLPFQRQDGQPGWLLAAG